MNIYDDPSYLNAELIDQIRYVQDVGLTTSGWTIMTNCRLNSYDDPKTVDYSMTFWRTVLDLSSPTH